MAKELIDNLGRQPTLNRKRQRALEAIRYLPSRLLVEEISYAHARIEVALNELKSRAIDLMARTCGVKKEELDIFRNLFRDGKMYLKNVESDNSCDLYINAPIAEEMADCEERRLLYRLHSRLFGEPIDEVNPYPDDDIFAPGKAYGSSYIRHLQREEILREGGRWPINWDKLKPGVAYAVPGINNDVHPIFYRMPVEKLLTVDPADINKIQSTTRKRMQRKIKR